jgi:hypothetical protein
MFWCEQMRLVEIFRLHPRDLSLGDHSARDLRSRDL